MGKLKVVLAIAEFVVSGASLVLGIAKGKMAKIELHNEIAKVAAEEVAKEFAKRAVEEL